MSYIHKDSYNKKMLANDEKKMRFWFNRKCSCKKFDISFSESSNIPFDSFLSSIIDNIFKIKTKHLLKKR